MYIDPPPGMFSPCHHFAIRPRRLFVVASFSLSSSMSHTAASSTDERRLLDTGFHRLRAAPEVHRLNFAWLIRLRWVAFVGQTAVIIASWAFLGLQLPFAILALILLLEVLSNVGLIAWARGTERPHHEAMGALVLIADIVFLTALLFFTGGAANPFSLLYIIHVALAALVLSPLYTWAVAFVSAVAYIGIHFFPGTADYLPWAAPPDLNTLEVQGSWVAFVVSAAVIAFFINMIQKALGERDEELMQMRDAQMKNEKLASLATLAAGAAHEFSTPLSTIALVSNELQRALDDEDIPDRYAEDAALIRDQVERCRDILRQMSAEAGESMGEFARPVSVAELIEHILDGCRDRDRVDVTIETERTTALTVPPSAVGQALRGLVNNALEASDDDQHVRLTALEDNGDLVIRVVDDGHGMIPEVLDRVDEPFFTTKEAGDGMGLGVFLARTVVEKLDGTIIFDSAPHEGTTAVVRLPHVPPAESPLAPDSTPELVTAAPEVSHD